MVHIKSRNGNFTVCGKPLDAKVIRDKSDIPAGEKLCRKCGRQKSIQLKLFHNRDKLA